MVLKLEDPTGSEQFDKKFMLGLCMVLQLERYLSEVKDTSEVPLPFLLEQAFL